MSFKDLNLKRTYNSEKDDILNDFYIPALKETVRYDRIAGYFSTSSFRIASEGISHLIKNKGKIRLLINIQLNHTDYELLKKSVKSSTDLIENFFNKEINEIKNDLDKNRFKVIGWMLKEKILRIKVGFIREESPYNEILHQKVGIMFDKDGNLISFSGSNNESSNGWIHNSEKFKVFSSWESGKLDYIYDDIEDFEDLWENRTQKTQVISFPKAIEQKLISISPNTENEVLKIIQNLEEKEIKNQIKSISLRGYQQEAILNWEKNNYVGLLEMATGTGKTFTAIGGLNKLLEKEEKLVTVITCPYLHLIPQWESSIKKFGINIHTIYASSFNSKWKEDIRNRLYDMKLNRKGREKLIILTSHETVSSHNFLQLLEDFKTLNFFIIGDEVHGMGSSSRLNGLSQTYKYRLGLSATPNRYFDDIGTKKLFNFFDKTVFEFDLHKAITEIDPMTGETFLTPYEYKPIFVDLDDEEFEEFVKLSKEIGKFMSIENKTESQSKALDSKLRKRQDKIKNAISKYDTLLNIIKELIKENDLSHTLIYCSPQQIDEVQQLICKNYNKIKHHRFTSEEDAVKKDLKYNGLTEREFLLKKFNDEIYQILVAIKCLDEGVDVPSTRNAILLSSTGNPKEYIQRRGRILRRFPGKDKAILYDLVVYPQKANKDYVKKILESELKRVDEFTSECLNKEEVEQKVYKIRSSFDL